MVKLSSGKVVVKPFLKKDMLLSVLFIKKRAHRVNVDLSQILHRFYSKERKIAAG
ncbi:MAG TPA: hypothetical protein VGK06_04945 [Methanosarcina sp.]